MPLQTFRLCKTPRNAVTIKQVQYVEVLAQRTRSFTPPSEQILIYCSAMTMQKVLNAMIDGRTIELLSNHE